MNKQKRYNYLTQCVNVKDGDSGVRPSQSTQPRSTHLLDGKVPQVHSHVVAKHESHTARSWGDFLEETSDIAADTNF